MTDFKAIASSLEERGFCVIPEFFSCEEIDFLVAEFDACPDYSPPPYFALHTDSLSPLRSESVCKAK